MVAIVAQEVEQAPGDLGHAAAGVEKEVDALALAGGLELVVNLGESVVGDHGVVVKHIGYHGRAARPLDRGEEGVALGDGL